MCLSGWFAETYSTTNLESWGFSFEKIGMQRQICRCINHFGRGINVVLLHRLCCFSLQNTILLSEDLCRKDRAVLMVGRNLQLFSLAFRTDSLHELKACEENSEATLTFNEGEGLFGDFGKSHIVISQELEETSAVNAFFLYKTAFWVFFMALKTHLWNIPLKVWKVEREILSECINRR